MGSEPISLAAAREARQRPNADCVKRDDEGREMFLFDLDYIYDGKRWSIDLWAYSIEDAQCRVSAMRATLIVDGQIYAVIPR